MFYPVPYEYHDLVVDRRDPRPERLIDRLAVRPPRRMWGARK